MKFYSNLSVGYIGSWNSRGHLSPVLWMSPPDPWANNGAADDEHLPDPDGKKDDPVTPVDGAIQTQCQQQRKYQQAGVNHKFAASRKDIILNIKSFVSGLHSSKIFYLPYFFALKFCIFLSQIIYSLNENFVKTDVPGQHLFLPWVVRQWDMSRDQCRGISIRADSRFAPSQWKMALLCNNVSHWLGANLESAL